MKVLITGASGFLGGHMAELFVGSGHDVRGLVRNTSRTELLEKLGVEIVRGDLKNHDSLSRAVEGVDVVVHAATTMRGIPQEYVESTVKGTYGLLEAAREAGVRRFVHISSISVYKMQKLSRGQRISEDFPYEDSQTFLTNYSRSKIDAERCALGFACGDEMQVTVLRPGILYGPSGDWKLPRIGYALGKNWFLVIGRGRRLLPVCYVRNCAQAALLAAGREGVGGGIFNIVDDEVFTQREYLRALKEHVRPRLRRICLPYFLARALGWLSDKVLGLVGRASPLHPAHLVACQRQMAYSNEKAKDMLGWRPQTSRDKALAETMQYHLERERVSSRADIRALGKVPENKPPLSVCLVGCGAIAETHLGILSRMKNAKVQGLCDVNLEAAQRLASRSGVPNAYEDLGEMLATERPQVLHILTPPQSHAHYSRLAAEHGCNVLVEKPMAVDAAQAGAMAELAARHGVQLCVDHNHLYDPTMVRARKLVESGALGDIVWVESYYGFNLGANPFSRYMVPGGENHWTFELPGGLYQNLAPHPLCLALELLGRPVRVHAHARSGHVLPHMPTDELRMLIETENAGGLVTVSLAATPRQQYLNIFGTRMSLSVDLLNKWMIPQKVARGIPRAVSRAMMNVRRGSTALKCTVVGMAKVLARRWTPFDGMELLVREYYASLQEGRQPPVSCEEGVDVMRVMDEAWRAVGSAALKWQ